MDYRADVEVVDPKKCLEESCKPKCVKPLLEYQACVKRIQDDESGHKHCTGQYFDYWQCVDKCVTCRRTFPTKSKERDEALACLPSPLCSFPYDPYRVNLRPSSFSLLS
ncbi:hypothetical protein Bca101_064286 [Brassica carinata]